MASDMTEADASVETAVGQSNLDHIESSIKQLEEALRRQFVAESTLPVKRHGTEIIVPEGVPINDVIKALQPEASAEEPRSMDFDFNGHPDDCVLAIWTVIKEHYANADADWRMTFFGANPPTTRDIHVSYDEVVTVPEDVIRIPGLPIMIQLRTYVNSSDKMKSTVRMTAKFPMMYKPILDGIAKEIREHLEHHSIFQGKAITSEFQFIKLDVDTSTLVHSAMEQRELDAHIYMPIKLGKGMAQFDTAKKRVTVLSGKYGTGKTFTAVDIAKTAVKHGWTFMLAKTGADIVSALEFANRFQPCVLFIEDIDRQTKGDRDEDLDSILNTIDGVLSKDAMVMIVMTTNDLESIHPAMKRPGRIDRIIEMGKQDPDSMFRLVQNNARVALAPDIDRDALYKAAANGEMSPAFIQAAVSQAARYAAIDSDDPSPDKIVLTTASIVASLDSLRSQWLSTFDKPVNKTPSLDGIIRDLIAWSVGSDEYGETLADMIDQARTYADNTRDNTYDIKDKLDWIASRVKEIHDSTV